MGYIAEVYGVCVSRALKWSRRAAESGVDVAIKGGQRGRRDDLGRTLTLVQEEQLRIASWAHPGPESGAIETQVCTLESARAVMLAVKRLFGGVDFFAYGR